jgi:glutamyl-tRNA synthetase
MALINYLFAKQQDGRFFLRIEDTDQVRQVDGASDGISSALTRFQIVPDEGPSTDGRVNGDRGMYGPYMQSRRLDIYWAAALDLLIKGKAYLCFATAEELDKSRLEQQKSGAAPGYYGRWALWRDADPELVRQKLLTDAPFVVRLRSEHQAGETIKWTDLIKGEITQAANFLDIVLIKPDRYPTYHFAHAVDDHFMRTTHVLRGEEWVSSVPVHLQLFGAFNWAAPQYGHAPLLQKIEVKEQIDPETGEARQVVSRRKISKRHDPEAAVDHYFQEGYCHKAITDYLLNIANSDFEQWRMAYPNRSWTEFPLRLSNFGVGALLDSQKLESINRDWIAKMTIDEMYESCIAWAQQNAPDLGDELSKDPVYAKQVLDIERGAKRMKTWRDLRAHIEPFYDKFYLARQALPLPPRVSVEDAKHFLQLVGESRENGVPREVWFNSLRELGVQMGFAGDAKQYKAAPQTYKGIVGDLMMLLRHAYCRSDRSPDLYQVEQALGHDIARGRLAGYADLLA